MTLHQKQTLFTEMFARLVLEAIRLGLEPVIDQVGRTIEQQRIYKREGKTKTLASKHLERLAGDLLLFRNGVYLTQTSDYAELGAWWKAQNALNQWGGDWGWDANHFEYNG